MAKRMLFIGAGAIGSYIGSFLARAGHDVTLVDPRPEQVEAVRRGGISVTGPHDPFAAKKAPEGKQVLVTDLPISLLLTDAPSYERSGKEAPIERTRLRRSRSRPHG